MSIAIATSLCTLIVCLSPLSAAQQPSSDKDHAPPPLEMDGVIGIPIDISSIQAEVVFDLETRTAMATADVRFEMTADGMPLFDLRQRIAKLSCNGEELDPELVSSHKSGPDGSRMRLLQKELVAGTQHLLHFEYPLLKPNSPRAIDIGWGDGTLDWDFFFSDLNSGRYMEMWFPANLLYDRFKFDLDLKINGATAEHQIVTNGDVSEIEKQKHWKLSFPPTFAAFSHMLVVVPSDKVTRSASKVKVGDRTIHLDVCKLNTASTSLKDIHKRTSDYLKEFSKSTAMWPHGDRCTVFVWTGGRSMEYDGATTTSMGALGHELFHSWFGRGLKPVSQNDGWWDEAWTVWFADGGRTEPKKIPGKGSPVELASSNPYNRTTNSLSYRAGSLFFSRLAKELGDKKLMKLMAEFFNKNYATGASTEEMAQFLYAKTQNDQVLQLFHRYIYGKEGSVMDKKNR